MGARTARVNKLTRGEGGAGGEKNGKGTDFKERGNDLGET